MTNGSVIIVEGTLTITDASIGGKIQGGYDAGDDYGYSTSCVKVLEGASFNLQGGTIIGRVQDCDYTVSVVYNSNFTMTGGKITGGQTGVLALGNVTLTGGEISGNNIGVPVGENFSISGNPVITGNTVMNADRILIVQKPVIADIPDQTYTGSEITPEPLVIAGSLNLTKGTDYVYSYTNNTNAGTATVRATFKGTYASLGYVEKTFRIIKLLTHSDITIATIPDQTYSGSEICPAVVVNDGKTMLVLGTDYTVECANNVSAGTANMTITGMGDYPGSVSKTFKILKAPLTVTALNDTIVYGDEPSNAGVKFSGFVNGEKENALNGTLVYSNEYKQYGNVGDYVITPSGLTADNYKITFVDGKLTVEPKYVAVTWDKQNTFTYDGFEHAPTATKAGKYTVYFMVKGNDIETQKLTVSIEASSSSSVEIASSSSNENKDGFTPIVANGLKVQFVRDELAVTVPTASEVKVYVFDLQGNLKKQYHGCSAGTHNVSLNQMNRGSYLVRVVSGGSVRMLRSQVK